MHLSGKVFVGVISRLVQKKTCLEKSLNPTPFLALSYEITQMEDGDGAAYYNQRQIGWDESHSAAPPGVAFLLSDALGITTVGLSPLEPWLSSSIKVHLWERMLYKGPVNWWPRSYTSLAHATVREHLKLGEMESHWGNHLILVFGYMCIHRDI